MKSKALFTTAILFFGGFFISSAQNDTRLGAMLAYGTEIENVGIGVNAEFPVLESLSISPGFIYYFPKDEYGVDLNWWELNGNAHYYFVNNESMDFYGIGGLNYSHVQIDYGNDTMFGDAEMSDGRFGLNLGAGANFDIGRNITPFAEAKYVIIDGSQLVIGAGVKFAL